MKKTITIFGLIMVLLVTGCETKQHNTQIANPASVFCEEKGGKLAIITAPDGSQSGECALPDGTKCEEWAYYRGECPGHTCTDEEKKKQDCPRFRQPVCGDNGVQYDNRCFACSSGQINSWREGECPKKCGSCPMLSPPSPDFCKDGKIVQSQPDECGCVGAPTCEPVACTMDAKTCPDGTAVGRIAPDCEFAPCPEECDYNSTAKKYVGKSTDECSRIKFICEPTSEFFEDSCGCGCQTKEFEKNNCTPESRKAKICTMDYVPVCGWFGPNVKCFKAPCAITESNGCTACINPNVEYWTTGACPK